MVLALPRAADTANDSGQESARHLGSLCARQSPAHFECHLTVDSMKNIFRDYPIGSIGLLLLACVRFEYHSQSLSWSVSSPGLSGGVAVLGIVAVVVLFRIFNAAQDACIARGLLGSRIQSRYDILIPIAIVLVAAQGRWYGAQVEYPSGQAGHQWELAWSDPGWAVPFIAALIGVVFLTRILVLVRALSHVSDQRS